MASKDDIKIKIDAAVNTAEAAKSLGQLRKSLMEIQTLQAEMGEGSGPNFDKLTQAANAASLKLAETRDRIGDIQDKNRTLEGTPIERLTGSFGLLRESVMNLDFDKAKIGAEGLLNTFTPVVDGKLVTGFAGIKGALSMLGDGFKSLGSTIVSVGKSILANPIFLLAAIIIGVVAAVVLIMDKLGILKKVIDALMIPINAVIAGFKMLTDWLGLTTYAQEENAKSAKKNGEEQRKQIDATANKQKAYAQLIQGMTEEEAAAFAKKAGIRDSFNKSSFDIEKERLAQTQITLKNEIDALEELKEAGGDLTDEQLKDLEQRKTDYSNNADQIKIIEAQKLAAIETMNKTTTSNLEAWQIKNIADKNERDKAQLKVEESNEIRKIDIQIAEAKRLGADYSKLESTKAEIRKFYATSEKEIDKAVAVQRNNLAKAERDKRKEEALKQLAELERVNQIAINKTKEGTEERMKAELKATQDFVNFQKEKQKILGINESQMTLLVQEAAIKKTKIEEDYKNGVETLSKETVLSQKRIAVEKAQDDEALLQARRDLIVTTAQFELKEAGDNATKMVEIQTKAANEVAALDLEFANKKSATELLAKENKVRDLEFELEYGNLTYAQKVKKLEEISTATLDYADKERATALSQAGLTAEEIASIEKDYRDKKAEAERDAHDAKMDLLQAEFDKYAEYGQKTVAIAQTFSDAIFISKKQNLDKEMKANIGNLKSGTKEYDDAQKKNFKISQDFARKQFNTNKALQLSSAVIDGFKSITSSLSQSPVAIGPIPNPAGIASLAFAVATSAANIAKIAASKFQEGTAPASTVPEAGAPGGGGGGGEAPTNFNPSQFFGLGQTTAMGMPGGPKPVKVYVSEGDIRDVSERVSVIEKRAVY